MIFSLSEKFSFGVASFDDGFAEFFELLPPRAKLSLGGDSLEVDSFGDKGLGVDSFRGLSTGEESAGGESVEDGVFEEDIIAPIAVII
ncbi:hypothetical protein [Moritella sp.]|uniref:hypothetical protein n=1 Tax=Moritella sp. TaxID=78556 RepID=UPI0025EDD1A3|nr:hypothetical protein [Moritella sp.]MCJ8350957.1 hypothetical protein [Moritella sp.]